MKASDNQFPHLTMTPVATPDPPADPLVLVFLDIADGVLKTINSAGVVTVAGQVPGV
jgi:hypothetical protein